LAEIPLLGGQLTPGIVRVGNTVRRPAKGNAAFVHDLLLFLEDQGFPFAPRFFGRDEQGRGHPQLSRWRDLAGQWFQATRCSAGSRLSQGREIVAHHELGPHNTNFQDGHLPEADAGSEQGG